VLTPPILVVVDITPLPIVAIDVDTEFRAVVIFLFDMPAVAFRIANDGGRRACRGQSEDADDPHYGASKMLHGRLVLFRGWWCRQTLGKPFCFRCTKSVESGVFKHVNPLDEEEARPWRTGLLGDAQARRFARGGANGNRAGHLNGCPTNRFQIAKKKPGKAQTTGLLAPSGANATGGRARS
jgi:hypothetical protein